MTSSVDITQPAGTTGAADTSRAGGGTNGAKSPPSAVVEGGSYDVVRRRLLAQAGELGQKAERLNEKRKQTFGGSELALIANERVRTEHNCVARDVVSVGSHLLFGFQVFMGLKTEVGVADVFGLCTFTKKDGTDEWDVSQAPVVAEPGSTTAFLANEDFARDLRDTFKYTKDARLLRLKRTDTRLFAAVQVGATPRDAKVFRWTIDGTGRIAYTDARGDEEMAPPRQHDFAWTPTRREDQVHGAHPHINILDTVFVETVGGDLTVKVENNTKDGKGIYREPVDDENQTLDDAEVAYAQVGQLILLKIRPFREETTRYLVFDPRARRVTRIDAIGRACHELPEDHGIVFPGGYYLQSGEHKVFEGDTSELEFERAIKSPNGEDVLYVYHARDAGEYVLTPYNLIRKEVATLVRCHGYSLFADGTMAVFRADAEPTRVHPLQIWRTPFNTAEHAAKAPTDGSYLAKVGNADLVRGISDALSLRKLANVETPTRKVYEDLVAALSRVMDAHHWLGHAEAFDLLSTLGQMRKTAELVLDEFDKVEAIALRAREALDEAREGQRELLARVRASDLRAVEDYLGALTALRQQRGRLITLRDLRGVDLASVAALEAEVAARADEVGAACVTYFLGADAFAPLVARLDEVVAKVEGAGKASELQPIAEELDRVQQGLTLLSEVASGLKVDDATARTRILEGVSAAFGHQNRARAVYQGRKKELAQSEGRAEFGAQFRLFGQAVTGAIASCDTPERCDEQLSKLLVALEELEGKFGEFDEFAPELLAKREEVNEAIGARRQQLLDERQRRAQGLMTAAGRILQGIGRRAKTFRDQDELNAYFASDAMVHKLGALEADLRSLGDARRAEDIATQLKSARQDAVRALRDKTELSGGEEGSVRLGAHTFGVNTQPLELVLVPKDGVMTLHLTGTEFFDAIDDPILEASRDLWEQTLVSETPAVYRGEFLACSMLFAAEDGAAGLTIDRLAQDARDLDLLTRSVRAWAEGRLDEGYERGVHDVDAARILEKLLSLRASAGLLRFSPDARALACLFWSRLDADARTLLHARGKSVGRLRASMDSASGQAALADALESPIEACRAAFDYPAGPGEIAAAARYLTQEIAHEPLRFVASATADSLVRALDTMLDEAGTRRAFEDELRALSADPPSRLAVATSYLEAFVAKKNLASARPYVREAAVMLMTDRDVMAREPSAATVSASVSGLLGAHPRIQNRTMELAIDEVLSRLLPYVTEHAERFRAFRKQKAVIVERERERLRVSEFQPKVLTSFVRNQLIDQVYLPLVGANLAKQLGALGATKRTDLMGMLLLVSPPGYGKTTLMEYVASKMGLVFMKVNGPALGHEVTSLDPAEARSATARQEVEKINLAFEMQSNVMLYLDDIQHVNTELLQKFISLCDAQRKVEGVWKGKTRTYDLRGKKFCVVMAGNPYTETGARFQIPDMLANRADTYNLGDILGGQEELFAGSYLENALTSNATLAPLAMRDPKDVQRLVRLARGEDVPLTELTHGYSAAEVGEITSVLRHFFRAQALLLEVNRQYILSASQEDAYRTEPPFKLQGSYRNMNKIAEKIVAAMNDEELEGLLGDHYASEAQTLTTGAEQNLLKLAEIRGRMSDSERARWQEIKDTFVRTRRAGGKGDDPVLRVTGALAGLDEQLQRIGRSIVQAAERRNETREHGEDALDRHLAKLVETLRELRRPHVELRVDDGTQGAAKAIVDVVREQARTMDHVVSGLSRLIDRPASAAPSSAGDLAPRVDALLTAVARLEQRLSQTAGGLAPTRHVVALDASSPSNFYRGLDGDDVIVHGGVFVATYAKLPSIGSLVTLDLEMPAGVRCDVTGTVGWTQEHLSDDTPAGFGVRLSAVSPEARALIGQFVRGREPLIRD